jgi:hypothetical protein
VDVGGSVVHWPPATVVHPFSWSLLLADLERDRENNHKFTRTRDPDFAWNKFMYPVMFGASMLYKNHINNYLGAKTLSQRVR